MDIQLEHSQSQVFSQKLIQSVRILQMSAQELDDYIKEMSLENPVVELEEIQQEDKAGERLRKLEWLSGLDEQNRIYYSQETEDSDANDIMNIGEREEETLKDNLMSQLIGGIFSDRELEIFEYIADCLDSRGFFTGTTGEISERFGLSKGDADRYLRIMKTLEPAGVCASSLQECLLRQLEPMGEQAETERQIVGQYLELLGKNRLQTIAKQLKVPLERVQEAKKRIQALNPKPGCGYSGREVLRYLTPDVTVVKLQGYFEVLVNDCAYPEIRVSQDYMRMLKGDCPGEVKQYIAGKVRQIEQVQSCISRRNATLTELAKYIVDEQKEFFTYGKGHLRPVCMREAAERLDVHESTVSRAVRDKYLQCCWGMFPMGYFFPKGFYEREGQEKLATVRIKQKLDGLIQAEDKKKPLSDQRLADRLAAEGIDISRRTVAKYREAMGIADCRGRREF